MIIPFQTKVSGLLVKVPDNANNSTINSLSKNVAEVVFRLMNGTDLNLALPPGSWQLIGEVNSLTDEQKRHILECIFPFAGEKVPRYKDYVRMVYDLYDADVAFSIFLKSLEVYSENPIEITQDEEDDNGVVGLIATVAHFRAEERTGKWLLLLKKED